MNHKALMIASPASGHGKTLVTRMIANQMNQCKHPIALIKLGPDYIDPTYHRLNTTTPCFNIDTWAMKPSLIVDLLQTIKPSRFIIIESATGLFDGAIDGTASACQFAETFHIPILLVIDCTAMGATVAAIVHGLTSYHKNLDFAGIVLNKVASENHARILKKSLENIDIPIVATLYRDPALHLERRHLGLTMATENQPIEHHLDSNTALPPLFKELASPPHNSFTSTPTPPIPPMGNHIAVADDLAFSFTYPHFLHYWKRMGATLSFFSPLLNQAPDANADAIFLPGGYPELHLETLKNAHTFKRSMQDAARRNVHIYGECGGFMVLGNAIINDSNNRYEMLNLLPHTTSFYQPKLTIGYRNLTLLQDCVLGKSNASFKGHCFHYTQMVDTPSIPPLFSSSNALHEPTSPFESDGYKIGSVCGSYHHIIASSHDIPS